MRKRSFIMIVAITITIFAWSVWAQNLPMVKMEGSVAKFTKTDNISDVDLSKISIGIGFENVPIELKVMLEKWWKG